MTYSPGGAFSAHFADNETLWPGGTTVAVQRFSFFDRGGCDEATLVVRGDVEQLATLFAMLGREVRIVAPSGDVVWWGAVNAVQVGYGLASVGASLSRMTNKVKVAYIESDAFGVTESKETDWSWSQSSIDRYGVKERVESIGNGNAAMAAARQAQILKRLAWPRPKRAGASEGMTAVLKLRGLMHFFDWRTYQNLVGRIENAAGGGDLLLVIGARYTSNRIGMFKRYLGDVDGKMSWLLPGDRITVSGSATGNNGVKNIKQQADPMQPRTYVSDLVEFEEENDVLDQSTPFDWVEAGQFIEISGSVKNSGIWLVRDREGSGHFEVRYTPERDVLNEPFGPTITILFGHSAQVDTGAQDEMPGASITLQSWNEQMAQRFTAPASMTLAKVAVSVGKHGSPADNLLIELCADNGTGDYPGAVLQTLTVTPAQLPEDEVREQWFSCNLPVTVGGMYWIKMRRSGAAAPDAYYLLGLHQQDTFGATRAWDGATWHHLSVWRPNTPNYSITYRLHDEEDTSESIRRIVSQCGGVFVTSTSIAPTGVKHNQWVDDNPPALSELERLLDIGNAAGERLTCNVTMLREIVVTPETPAPADDFDLPYIGLDERLYTPQGSLWPAGMNPVGQWVRIAGVPRMAGLDYRLSPDYVRAAEYDVEEERWRIAFRDDEDMVEGI